jgi:hypothetical protein
MDAGEHPLFRAGPRKKSGCISLPMRFFARSTHPVLTPVKINRGSLGVISMQSEVTGGRLAWFANPAQKTGCMDFTHARDRLQQGPAL